MTTESIVKHYPRMEPTLWFSVMLLCCLDAGYSHWIDGNTTKRIKSKYVAVRKSEECSLTLFKSPEDCDCVCYANVNDAKETLKLDDTKKAWYGPGCRGSFIETPSHGECWIRDGELQYRLEVETNLWQSFRNHGEDLFQGRGLLLPALSRLRIYYDTMHFDSKVFGMGENFGNFRLQL